MNPDLVARLSARFEREYGRLPQAIARAPGRVNLIGEHVDYCGLAVFPMAIGRAVRVAFRARGDGRVRLVDLDPAYEPRELELSDEIVPCPRGDWGNYAKAAAQALVRELRITRGIDGVVASDLPRESGLSSSSALVVATALALAEANGIAVVDAVPGAQRRIAREALAELCTRGERYVGTDSGGMDQAISLGARAGCAAVVRFDPLELEPLRVPEGWRFLVAQSFVRAPKSGAAREAYNARARETREALAALAAHPAGRELARRRLGTRPFAYRALVADVPEPDLLAAAREALAEPLLRRFRHVVTEGRRVERAREAMIAGDERAFGALMDASHASLRDDFEVSVRELDELVLAARAAGAVGARLSGAGFGGSIVALCRAGDAEAAVRSLHGGWHAPRGIFDEDAAFVALPAAGAEVSRL